MKTVKDQLHRVITVAKTPKRIISLVPSQTELLYDLGLEDRIAGITKFCVHPSHFKNTKVIVGGTKHIKINKIKALQPDIILCNKEENTPEMIQELEAIAPVHISDIYTIDDCLELIAMYGSLFSISNKALNMVNTIKEKQYRFEAFCKNKPKIKVAYFIWSAPWMVAAGHTFINHILTLNHFENCYGHLLRYPEIQPVGASSQVPEVILLSSEPYPFKEKHKEELMAFFPDAKIIFVDGEMFSWYGSRLIKAFDYFKTLRQDYLT